MRATYEVEYDLRRQSVEEYLDTLKRELKQLTDELYNSNTPEEFDRLIGEREQKVSKVIATTRQLKDLNAHPDPMERISDSLGKIADTLESIEKRLSELKYWS